MKLPSNGYGRPPRAILALLAVVTACCLCGCGAANKGVGAAVTALPSPPITIAKPALPPAAYRGEDLSQFEAVELAGLAQEGVREEDYRLAALAQRWAIEKGDLGHYNLACFESRVGNYLSAFYWLQEAGLKEGVDTEWAQQDPDLDRLRRDPRWKPVLAFLVNCEAYWAQSGVDDHCLMLPTGYQGQPIPVMVWLHGMGDRAASYLDPELQAMADRLQIAFVSVSGTHAKGPASFTWSDDMQANRKRIDEAFAKFASKLKPQEGQIALGGFSQGGQVAGELAARDPQRFSGALIMSPGGFDMDLDSISTSPEHGRQAVVCVCGAGEHRGNVALTRAYAQWYKSAGSRVVHKSYPGMDYHGLVPDYYERLPHWLPNLLDLSATGN